LINDFDEDDLADSIYYEAIRNRIDDLLDDQMSEDGDEEDELEDDELEDE
jgi:hypothetical protein